jgi:osmotically-inducible protein OsmY
MEYARIEITLIRKVIGRPSRVQGAVGGPAYAVAIDPATLRVVATTVAARRMRQLGLQASEAVSEPSTIALEAGLALVTSEGVLGRVAQLWVDRESVRLMDVLVQPIGASADTLHTVPAAHLTSIAPNRLSTGMKAAHLAALPRYRADSEILADVRDAIASVLADPRARRTVKAHVDDGHVWVTGEVDTSDQAEFVRSAVARIRGARWVTSDLVSQEDLAQAVEARIRAAANGAGSFGEVSTLTEHGIVYLEGSVPTQAARAEVERIALGVAGARVVVNNLRVAGDPPERNPGTGPLVRNR